MEALSSFSIMNLRHYDHDGRARFIEYGIHHGIPVLTNDHFRLIVLREIFSICHESEIRLLGYVIMPEHVHEVLVPPDHLKLGPCIGELKRRIAVQILPLLRQSNSPLLRQFRVLRNGEERDALWIRRCWDHNCRTESEVWEKVNYCHQNPVKRGLVASADRWRWSSYAYYKNLENTLLEIDVSRDPIDAMQELAIYRQV